MNRILCPGCVAQLYPHGVEEMTCSHACGEATCIECGKEKRRPGAKHGAVWGAEGWACLGMVARSRNAMGEQNAFLHARIAAKLGWTFAEVRSFDLPSLRELVRDDANLVAEVEVAMNECVGAIRGSR